MIIKMKIKIIIRELLFLIGLFLISWFIWIKFLRGRLPKDIPYLLTEERFYILILICLVYLYLIKKLLFPKYKENYIIKDKLYNLSESIFKPFYVVDEKMKENKYILKKIINFLDKLALKDVNYLNLLKEFYFMNLMPRLVLVLILLIDIFFFYKISIFYKFVILSILPLLLRFKKFQIKESEKSYINYYEKIIGIENIELIDVRSYDEDEEYEDEENEDYKPLGIYHDKEISVFDFLDLTKNAKPTSYSYSSKKKNDRLRGLKGDEMTTYLVIVNLTDEGYRNNKELNKNRFTKEEIEAHNHKEEAVTEVKRAKNIKWDEVDKLGELYRKLVKAYDNDIITLATTKDFEIRNEDFLLIVTKLQNLKKNIIYYTNIEDRKDIKIFKLIIYISYLICWSYFLYKSYETLNNLEITGYIVEKIKNYTKENIDPFSDIKNDI
jgi:hypothetical protein